ncbi:MAG: type IV secretion system protein TraC [Gammaproteobacteria bacterium]|nr:MAG: type IV secretion system protein TraC [Gammaproteobacteria bacterium]
MRTPFSIFKKTDGTVIPEEFRFSKMIPVRSYSIDDEIFKCEEAEEKSVSFGFHCAPCPGPNDKMEEQIKALINEYYPVNTMMQIVSFRSRDTLPEIAAMKSLRRNVTAPILGKIIEQRGSFIKKHSWDRLKVSVKSDSGVSRHDLGLVHDLQLYITIRIPISGNDPTQEEIEDILTIKTKVRTALQNVMLQPVAMTASSWIRLMGTLLNWSKDSSWVNNSCDWDKDTPLCYQVLDMDNDIEISKKNIRIGEKYVKVLSPKRRPQQMYFGEASYAVGDLMGRMNSVSQNYFIAATIHFPDVQATKSKLDTKRSFAITQAQGKLVKFLPQLVQVADDHNVLYGSFDKGMKPVRLSYHVGVFADSEDEAESAATAVRNFWRGLRFELMEDKSVSFPIFLSCLPFCGDYKAVISLERHKTVTAKEAAPFLPIFGEWKGTGTPHLNLYSRNMQLMTFSLHDSPTNKNGIIAATSGAGKSFFTNEIISSYMSEGAQVWVIDVGYSYKKLCSVFEGDFIQFGGGANACLNPFPLVVSLDGTRATCPPEISPDFEINDEDAEEDALVGLISAMAAQTERLTDFQTESLKAILRKVWMLNFRKTTITDIRNECLAHDDQRVKDIGVQLGSFSEGGSYERYFNGKNTVSFTNQFTVLELEELKGKVHLQQVVLLQLIYQIQQEIYLGERNRKKLVIIDEAWDLLNKGDVAKFIESGYRRFRKYGGSIVIVTQSISDLEGSATGRAILENTATKLILKQDSSSVENLKQRNFLGVHESVYELMKTVDTVAGLYSEVFIMSPRGRGIGRLIVNDFQKLLYSTTPEEEHVIKTKISRGLSLENAIEEMIYEREAA